MERNFYEFGQISTEAHETDQIIIAAAGSGTHRVSPSTTLLELECQPGDLVHHHYLNHSRVKANIMHVFKILVLISSLMQSKLLK